ncbi:MAG: alpha/beta hydrolase [Candidatus Omnitrophica bacterium]|nr:alpha/beta hydrolase [Candidatus Omnitrophota bacterium]
MEKSFSFKSGRYSLAGILHIPSRGKGPYPAVVMFHGFTGSKSGSHFIFTKTARRLAAKGMAVLRFDFMGSGDSEGKFENMSLLTEIKDGKKAVEFIMKDKTFDKNRLGVLGLSMGAVTAVSVALEYKTRSLVLWSPVAYPEIMRKKLPKKLEKILFKKGRVYPPGFGNYLGKKFIKSTEKVKPLESAESYRGNVLLVHAKDDVSVPLKHSLSYFKSFHKNALFPRILVLDEGGHTLATEFSEQEAIGETVGFFAETLL